MHAVRDPRRDGGGVRGLPRAGVLLSGKRSRSAQSGPTEWWAAHFDAHYLHEYEPIFDEAQDRREVARLVELLELPAGARILDVPCGQGRHTRLLAEAGYATEGLDLSEPLLEQARRLDPGEGRRYRRGDMRRLPSTWSGRFDAVLNLFTSFGFFLQPGDDAAVMAELARVLRPGGTLVWHGGSRDGVMARFLPRDWWRTSDGTLFAQERAFDPLAGLLHIRASWNGPSGSGEREHRIRLYTATRLAELMAEHGLIVEQAFDGWKDRPLRRTSSEMVLIARKTG